MIRTLKRLLPIWLKKAIIKIGMTAYDITYPFLSRDYPYYCPVCGNCVKCFHPLPDFYRQNKEKYGYPYRFEDSETLNYQSYSCPRCRSSDRSRLYALWLLEQIGRNNHRSIRLLEIAPSKPLSRFIRRFPNVQHRSADLNSPEADDKVDIMKMDIYGDETFDAFLCSHVLEHVADDSKALLELYRILAYEGWGILMAPINLTIETTDEDPTVTNVAERWRRFGQHDHIRSYAKRDFLERMGAAGFTVKQLGIGHFGAECFRRCGITEQSVLYIVEKRPNENN